MKIIVPLLITDAVLTSSDVPETDYGAWSAVTSYVVGDRVTVADVGVHKNYEALSNNTNEYPPDYSGGATPHWLDLGADNRWRMFDNSTGTITSQIDSITVSLMPGVVFNSLALFGLSGLSVNVTITGDAEDYNQDFALTSSPGVTDWYTYYFAPFAYTTELVITDLPGYTNSVLAITITAASGDNAECGHVAVGSEKDVGAAVFGTSIGILDYSRKEKDGFGNPIIVPRKFSQTVDYDVRIKSANVRDVQRTLADLRTTPVVWMGSTIFESTNVFGWYRDFSIVLEGPEFSKATIQVEEFK